MRLLHAVIETPGFVADARRAAMSAAERAEVIDYLAREPSAGVLIPGAGGARKLRWRRPGTGKSGGYRIITFFGGADVPVFLLNVFTKGERADLSQAERNELREVLSGVAAAYREGVRRNVKVRRKNH
jgi:hypothetical protein